MLKRKYIFAICFMTCASAQAAECDTDLKPSDPASKFIEALQCINAKLAMAQSTAEQASASAAEANANARRSAAAAESANSKLDRMFQKSFQR